MSNRRMMMFSLGSLPSTNFLTNLVAYYSFDASNATDIHTGTHNGTLVGSPTFPSGKNSNCINFGNNLDPNWVDVADSTDFSFTDGVTDVPFAISMWVKFDGFGVIGNWLINKRNATSGGDEYQFLYSGGRIQMNKFQYNNNAIAQQIATTSSLVSLGTWYHILYTDTGTGAIGSGNIYINGILNVDINTNLGGTYTRMNNGTQLVRIGKDGFGLTTENGKHRGGLDEIAIWKNVTYGATQATELWDSGAGKFYNTF